MQVFNFDLVCVRLKTHFSKELVYCLRIDQDDNLWGTHLLIVFWEILDGHNSLEIEKYDYEFYSHLL